MLQKEKSNFLKGLLLSFTLAFAKLPLMPGFPNNFNISKLGRWKTSSSKFTYNPVPERSNNVREEDRFVGNFAEEMSTYLRESCLN